MKVFRSALLVALMMLTVLAAPAGAATGKPSGPGKGNPYPPGQDGKCDTGEEHGGCPPGSKGKGNVSSFSNAARAGESYEAEGSGFKPGSKVEALLDGVHVASITTDGAGTFKTAVPIPSDAKAGARTVTFKGTGPDGQVVEKQLPLVVSAPDLASAASSTRLTVGGALLAVLALLALAAGLTVLFRGRRVAAEGF